MIEPITDEELQALKASFQPGSFIDGEGFPVVQISAIPSLIARIEAAEAMLLVKEEIRANKTRQLVELRAENEQLKARVKELEKETAFAWASVGDLRSKKEDSHIEDIERLEKRYDALLAKNMDNAEFASWVLGAIRAVQFTAASIEAKALQMGVEP